MMIFTPETKLKDILAAYPWLPDTLAQMDERLKVVKSPLVKALIQRATIQDASKRSGYPVEQIISELQKVIAAHEGQNA